MQCKRPAHVMSSPFVLRAICHDDTPRFRCMLIESYGHVGNLTTRDIMLCVKRCRIHMQADLHVKPCLGHIPLIAGYCKSANSFLGQAVGQHHIEYCTGARAEDCDTAVCL